MSAGCAGLDTNPRCFAANAGSNLANFQMTKGSTRGPILRLVAGARLSNYMQIEVEPFQLVGIQDLS